MTQTRQLPFLLDAAWNYSIYFDIKKKLYANNIYKYIACAIILLNIFYKKYIESNVNEYQNRLANWEALI